MKPETITINGLISALEQLKVELQDRTDGDPGNLPVVISSDAEGNSYNTISYHGSFDAYMDPDDEKVKTLIIYPYYENIDL